MLFEELVAEQTRMQLDFDEPKERSRTIDEYSDCFDFKKVAENTGDNSWRELGILKILEDYYRQKGHVVWADLGAGNLVALRGGKRHFKYAGWDPKALRAYGYDALPVDEIKVRYLKIIRPSRIPRDILDEEYRPIFSQEDISTVKFREKPDLITCIEILQYTEDPLKIFANAARQAPIGAILCFNALSSLLYTNDPSGDTYTTRLFRKITDQFDGVPGFKMYYLDRDYDNFILEKTEEIGDFSFGFRFVNRTTSKKLGQSKYAYTDVK